MSADLDSVRERYERDGYVIVRNVVDGDLLEEGRAHIRWLLEQHPGIRPEQLHNDLMQDDPFWVRLVSDDRLLDLAEQFIGPNIALFASHYIAKQPYDGQAVLWHQDGGFWPLEPMEVVTFWLALDDTTPENGCLRLIPESHTLDLQTMHERTDVENVLGAEIDLSSVDESKAVDVLLHPGDVEIHHPNLIHGSHANTSPKWRRGLTIRYIPATTRILSDGPFPSAFILRGQAVPEVNVYQPWPHYAEGRHMSFGEWQEWNRRSDLWNRRNQRQLTTATSENA